MKLKCVCRFLIARSKASTSDQMDLNICSRTDRDRKFLAGIILISINSRQKQINHNCNYATVNRAQIEKLHAF